MSCSTNGTTTAQVFGTVHKASIDAFFAAAAARDCAWSRGKVLMDRNAPAEYATRRSRESAKRASSSRRGTASDRLHYAITPRFAPTSTAEQLASAGKLAREYPDVFIHSHRRRESR